MFIALTGGIGCGKSRALAEFSRCGFECDDADRICHGFYATDSGRAAVAKYWPATVDASGTVDRRHLGNIVFRDQRELIRLEELIMPWLATRLAELHRRSEPVMVEVPLLFEKKLDTQCDAVVAVWSSFAVRRLRLAARNWDSAECARRERLQWTPEQKLAACDFGIINQGSLDLLEKQCRTIARKILQND